MSRNCRRPCTGPGSAPRPPPGWGRPGSARGSRQRNGSAGRPDRFGLLLLVLVSSYLLSAFMDGAWVRAVQIVLFVAVTALALRTGHVSRRTARRAITLAVAGSAVAVALALTHYADAGAGVSDLWAALMLLFTVALIVRRVLAQPVVTIQSILGAVSAYMIIGLMFAVLYSAMGRFGGHFFAHGQPGTVKTYQYFSFTTLTTLGYGDFTAADPGGRAVAVMEALLGQVFLATLVARLVAAFRVPGRRAPGPAARRPGRRGGPVRGRGKYARPGRPGTLFRAGRGLRTPTRR